MATDRQKSTRTEKPSLYDELKAAADPDKHNLDAGWEHQPMLFFQTADGAAAAKRDRDFAALDLKQTVARLDRDLREAHTKAGEKFTEASLVKEIELEDEVVQATRALVELDYQVARWAAMERTYSERSRALKGLTELNMASWYQTNTGRSKLADNIRERGGEERRNRD